MWVWQVGTAHPPVSGVPREGLPHEGWRERISQSEERIDQMQSQQFSGPVSVFYALDVHDALAKLLGALDGNAFSVMELVTYFDDAGGGQTMNARPRQSVGAQVITRRREEAARITVVEEGGFVWSVETRFRSQPRSLTSYGPQITVTGGAIVITQSQEDLTEVRVIALPASAAGAIDEFAHTVAERDAISAPPIEPGHANCHQPPPAARSTVAILATPHTAISDQAAPQASAARSEAGLGLTTASCPSAQTLRAVAGPGVVDSVGQGQHHRAEPQAGKALPLQSTGQPEQQLSQIERRGRLVEGLLVKHGVAGVLTPRATERLKHAGDYATVAGVLGEIRAAGKRRAVIGEFCELFGIVMPTPSGNGHANHRDDGASASLGGFDPVLEDVARRLRAHGWQEKRIERLFAKRTIDEIAGTLGNIEDEQERRELTAEVSRLLLGVDRAKQPAPLTVSPQNGAQKSGTEGAAEDTWTSSAAQEALEVLEERRVELAELAHVALRESDAAALRSAWTFEVAKTKVRTKLIPLIDSAWATTENLLTEVSDDDYYDLIAAAAGVHEAAALLRLTDIAGVLDDPARFMEDVKHNAELDFELFMSNGRREDARALVEAVDASWQRMPVDDGKQAPTPDAQAEGEDDAEPEAKTEEAPEFQSGDAESEAETEQEREAEQAETEAEDGTEAEGDRDFEVELVHEARSADATMDEASDTEGQTDVVSDAATPLESVAAQPKDLTAAASDELLEFDQQQ
jgi:hypothetical protein